MDLPKNSDYDNPAGDVAAPHGDTPTRPAGSVKCSCGAYFAGQAALCGQDAVRRPP